MSREEIPRELLERMTRCLFHRGPDEEGYFIGDGVGLGHRRLSIIDLQTGSQPIFNEDGSIVVVFNGEIYNFQEIRRRLTNHIFKTRTDTEVIVHLYEERGERCVDELRGMFSFAIWDSRRRRLFSARDRVGKKPFYYSFQNGVFAFGSELKSLREVSGFRFSIEPEAIDDFLTLQYIPSPRTIYREAEKLPPAHWLVFDGGVRVERYWSPPVESSELAEEEWMEELRETLEEAVRLRLISDVPLGAFLSGGIDSSITVALMSRLSGKSVRTFSIGFPDPRYDELRYARLIAERYETEHTELRVEPRAMEALPELIEHYDEPFGDSSALPTFYVAKMGSEFVKVVLTGDGGDECFAGYDRYSALKLSLALDKTRLGSLAGLLRLLPGSVRPRSLRRRLKRFAESLRLEPHQRYISWVTFFPPEQRRMVYRAEFNEMLNGYRGESYLGEKYEEYSGLDPLQSTVLLDLLTYLPEDLLVKMDRASMANSLEARSPLLDHKVVELACRIPVRLRLKGLKQKYILKRAFEGLLPGEILNRRKMGFGVPMSEWLRGELSGLLRETLLSGRARCLEYFERMELERLITAHLEGKGDYGARLWLLLILELWLRRWASP